MTETDRHKSSGTAQFPSEIRGSLSLFDRAATWADRLVSRAGFFVFCSAIVLIWLPSYFVIKNMDTWQLIINTVTTIVVFLLMALLQNTQKRVDDATQHKLNAIADGLADLMEVVSREYPDLDAEQHELRDAVGLEDRESSE
ncbi:low affinity iron permease family protein [Gordonia liuliyuniae]|uniref:Low affinity iron permease family protein n=1 Tax=Gordonia liuliyuniae TaxID=2911517 RepID=A0ABS9IQJ3_9ACTN|nr:low affinity iron permease family protein [Gordonia liuliyuniae]MCF8587800.1 low affinity iron permease family protein [Gordonia liuliyuniae]